MFPIPTNALKEGAERCLQKAKELYEDARLLSDHDRHAAALSLLILSAEEASLGLVVMDKLDKQEKIPKVEWERWTRGSAHIQKLAYLRNAFRRIYGIDLFKPFTEKELQELKEFGLYINWKENHEWSASFERLERKTLVSLHDKILHIAHVSIELLNKRIYGREDTATHITKEAEEEIRTRLRALGYLE